MAYRNRVRDLIVFQCDANFDCPPNNVANATLKGVTSRATRNGATRRSMHPSTCRSEDDADTGRLLPRRARRHGVASMSQALGRARVVAEVVGSSARFDDAENQRRLGGYGIVNLVLEWMVDARTTLFVRGDNVFDRDYQLAADFSTGGASVFGGVRWQM